MIIFYSLIIIFGLILGSFANVCISRIPKEESIISPLSHCPKCGEPIKWFDNIPVVSFIVLRAKCRKCRERISIQYPLIELTTGIAFFLAALRFKIDIALLFYMFFILLLIIISAVDFYYMVIPDSLSLAILSIGIIGCFFGVCPGASLKSRLINSLLGVITGGGTLYVLGFIGSKLMNKEAIGGGDIKLLAAIGAVLGWSKIFPVLLIASFVGSIFGIILIISKKIERKGYIPFGPFIALSAFINIFIPNTMGFAKFFIR